MACSNKLMKKYLACQIISGFIVFGLFGVSFFIPLVYSIMKSKAQTSTVSTLESTIRNTTVVSASTVVTITNTIASTTAAVYTSMDTTITNTTAPTTTVVSTVTPGEFSK